MWHTPFLSLFRALPWQNILAEAQRHPRRIPACLRAALAGLLLLLPALAAAAPFAYIANNGSNTVSVIDTTTNIVTATVPVGSYPYGVAVNPAGTRVYVTNSWDDTISVIDTASNSVIDTVTVGNTPIGVAVSPDGTRVYVANESSNTVSVIDTTDNNSVTMVAVGTWPSGVAVNPTGTRVYVANYGSNTVSVIDTTDNNSVIDTVTVGNIPIGVAVSPDGSRVYVANESSNTVSVIDTTNSNSVTPVAVGDHPYGVAVNPAGTRVYVANSFDDNVSIIDTADNSVTTVQVGDYPYGVAVNPAGTRVYVANQDSNNVSVIDTATNTVIDTVAVGIYPFSLGQFIGEPSDTTPDAFDFTAQTNVALSTVATSNTITVSGINTASMISIVGGEYAVSTDGGANWSAWSTTAPATANLNDQIKVRQTTSGNYSTTTTATLTIGGVMSGVFQVTTAAQDTTPNPFSFTAQTGVALSTVATSNTITVSGINTASAINIVGGTYSINGGGYVSTAGTVNNNDTVTLQQTSSGSYSTLTTATLTIGGVSGAFDVTTLAAPAVATAYTAPSATGTGDISASFSGGGPGCSYTVSQFIPLTGDPVSPPSAPPGVSFPHGLFDFTTGGCTPGSTITMVITYPQALPAGTVYWKYGPSPAGYNCTGGACAAAHWYQMPATINGNTVTFSITDGGLGDDDLTINGTIVDQGGPGVPSVPSGAASIPTLSEWALMLLAGLMGLFGMAQVRQRKAPEL